MQQFYAFITYFCPGSSVTYPFNSSMVNVSSISDNGKVVLVTISSIRIGVKDSKEYILFSLSDKLAAVNKEFFSYLLCIIVFSIYAKLVRINHNGKCGQELFSIERQDFVNLTRFCFVDTFF